MAVFRRRPAAPTSAFRFPSGRLGRRDRSRRIGDQCVGRGHGGRHGEPGDDGEYRRLRGGRRWLAVSVIRRDGREFTSSQSIVRRAQGSKLLQAAARTPHAWPGYPLLRPTGNAACACRLSGAVDADGSCSDPAVLALGVEYQGRYFIFFEELPYRTGKGHLMAMEVFDNAEPGEAQIILKQPYHLSYPFVFDWEGALYMIPETAENRTVELYRCEAFPQRWRLHEILLRDVDAVDTTLWREGNRWWMFVNIAEPGVDSNDELQ